MIRFSIILLAALAPFPVVSQTVLNSPADAAKYPGLNLQNIRWSHYQTPHYVVKGFSTDYLQSDFFALEDYRKAEQVLFQKINLYRQQMGLGKLEWDDTAAVVCRGYAQQLAAIGDITHTLNGTTPTGRMQPHFRYRVYVGENLQYYGGTIETESVDAYTDYVLHCWINSSGHNRGLLLNAKTGCVGFYCKMEPEKNLHFTVCAFNTLSR